MRQLALAAITALLAASGAAQATDVGVSIGISQPGVHGRIDIGRFPQPAVVVAQPVWVQPPRMAMAQPMEPVYLWVPPGHRRHWHQHCARYNACGVPVMFVQDRWYRDHVYRPHATPAYAPAPHGHVSPVQYAPPPRHAHPMEMPRAHEGRGQGHGHEQGRQRGHDRGRGQD